MGNPSYKAGVRLEYEIMQLLKMNLDPQKYTIIRTAGSHSPVDVFVIDHRGASPFKKGDESNNPSQKAFGIQCKSKKGVKK